MMDTTETFNENFTQMNTYTYDATKRKHGLLPCMVVTEWDWRGWGKIRRRNADSLMLEYTLPDSTMNSVATPPAMNVSQRPTKRTKYTDYYVKVQPETE